MGRLPSVPELGHRLRLAVGDEHRVVAEALAAAALVSDRPVERAAGARLAAVRKQADELADVARPPIVLALELPEQPVDAAARLSPAGGVDARATAERVTFSRERLDELLDLASGGIEQITAAQQDALSG